MSRLATLLTWLAFPVYVWQGIGVRRRTERMYPAKGPVLHAIPGDEPAISLLVLGDSSAASVGIGHSENGLAAQLALILSRRTARAVRWRAAGFNSATSGQVRDHVLPNLSAEPWTHIVLSIGTNDTKNFHSVPRFKKEFGGLLYALRAKWPEARVVWSPVVEFTRVPALPPLLGRILEIRAGAINRMGERLCLERGAVPAARLPILDPLAGFSTDGFHASEAGYRAWAEHLADLVLGEVDDSALPVTKKDSQRDRPQRDNRQLPEIAPVPQARQAERFDNLDYHHGDDNERQSLGHAAFEQERRTLSKLRLAH